METGLTTQRIVAELTKSPHGDLNAYVPIARQATKEMPEFMAHLIAWNQIKGEIRDSKVALPIATLPLYTEPAFIENALAHVALLDPRNLVRAVRFGKQLRIGKMKMHRLVDRYLKAREADPGQFIRSVLTHRRSMQELYALNHTRPGPWADSILFKGARPPGPLQAVHELKNMSPRDAAVAIIQHRLPFLTVTSALGDRAKDVDLVMAMIDQMSPAELLNNTKMLERLGVKTVPALRAAYEAGLKRVVDAAGSKAPATLKATKAAAQITDTALKAKVIATQEKQIKAKGIEGDWLVLGDKSGSMAQAIETARVVAATLAKFVKGQVNLIWFDNMPRAMNVTGKSYDEILAMTKHVTASGGTSIGCGLQWAVDKAVNVQGIAVVSDGGENGTPWFHDVYKRMSAKDGTQVPVYFYRVRGESDVFSRNLKNAGIDAQVFDLGHSPDYYSLPNLVQTMRASRYSLHDEIMETALLTLDEVFSKTTEREAA